MAWGEECEQLSELHPVPGDGAYIAVSGEGSVVGGEFTF